AATSDVATGVHLPLEVATLVLSTNDRSAMFVLATWDNCMWYRVDDWRRFQSQVLNALGLQPEQFVIALSHTHSGVHTCRTSKDLPGGPQLPSYMDSVAQAVIDSAEGALERLRPATIEWTTGHSELAANRELLVEEQALV